MSAAEVVVDASLAFKWVVEEPYSGDARSLLAEWGNHRRKLLAPALFLYEVANALAKRMQRREFTLEQAKERLRFFLESGPLLQQIGAIHPRALELMDRFGLPTVYENGSTPTLHWRNPSAASAGPPMNGCGIRLSASSRGSGGLASGLQRRPRLRQNERFSVDYIVG